MPEGDKGGQPTIEQLQADLEYHKGEAKKAFLARDEVKQKLRDIEGRVITDDDRVLFEKLRKEHADLEEQRKLKAGEFEAAKQELEKRHATETGKLKDQLATISKRLRDREVDNAFFGATEYFGGNDAKTILPPDIARDSLGKYVEVQEVDLGDGTKATQVVVKDARGETIRGDDGKPAPFAEAIGTLILGLPNKDRILRGSGKVGSGSSGGAHGAAYNQSDLDADVKAVQRGDKEAMKRLQARQGRIGGMVRGAAFETGTR